jgi:sugar phosphate isomerase/epimerase
MLLSRRDFLSQSTSLVAGALAATGWKNRSTAEEPSGMRFGLVTYLWGEDWDLPTLLKNCELAGILGVELRTTHKHGVEPSLSAAEREEVRKQFEDSGVTFVGPGSNERFDSPNPAELQKAIEATKSFIQLSHDIGGTGVKVKPDGFHKGVPREKTIEQIGKTLNALGEFAGNWGQELRLEVHGQCAELPTIDAIMKHVSSTNVGLCWNCNPQDLQGAGLESNFKLVRERFGATLHVHQLEDAGYPYPKLFQLLKDSQYYGWILLEASGKPDDRVSALKQQREFFEKLMQ